MRAWHSAGCWRSWPRARPPASQPLPGLDVTVTKVERAATASLRDCPPGSNTVTAITRPGEQFALVTVAFKVAPSFQPAPMKRPSIVDAADKKFNTAAHVRRRRQGAGVFLHVPISRPRGDEAEGAADRKRVVRSRPPSNPNNTGNVSQALKPDATIRDVPGRYIARSSVVLLAYGRTDKGREAHQRRLLRDPGGAGALRDRRRHGRP